MQNLFSVFDTSFYRALYAKGRLRENALLSPTLGFIQFPIVYLMFKAGCSPVVSSWTGLVTYALLGLIIKPLLIIKIVNYTWKDILSVFVPCLKVTAVAVILPILSYAYLTFDNRFASLLTISSISILSVGLSVWFLGLNKEMKAKVVEMVKKKIGK